MGDISGAIKTKDSLYKSDPRHRISGIYTFAFGGFCMYRNLNRKSLLGFSKSLIPLVSVTIFNQDEIFDLTII